MTIRLIWRREQKTADWGLSQNHSWRKWCPNSRTNRRILNSKRGHFRAGIFRLPARSSYQSHSSVKLCNKNYPRNFADNWVSQQDIRPEVLLLPYLHCYRMASWNSNPWNTGARMVASSADGTQEGRTSSCIFVIGFVGRREWILSSSVVCAFISVFLRDMGSLWSERWLSHPRSGSQTSYATRYQRVIQYLIFNLLDYFQP